METNIDALNQAMQKLSFDAMITILEECEENARDYCDNIEKLTEAKKTASGDDQAEMETEIDTFNQAMQDLSLDEMIAISEECEELVRDCCDNIEKLTEAKKTASDDHLAEIDAALGMAEVRLALAIISRDLVLGHLVHRQEIEEKAAAAKEKIASSGNRKGKEERKHVEGGKDVAQGDSQCSNKNAECYNFAAIFLARLPVSNSFHH